MLNPVAGIAAVAVCGLECIGLLAGANAGHQKSMLLSSYLGRLLVRPGCSGPSHLDQSGPSARHGRHVRAGHDGPVWTGSTGSRSTHGNRCIGPVSRPALPTRSWLSPPNKGGVRTLSVRDMADVFQNRADAHAAIGTMPSRGRILKRPARNEWLVTGGGPGRVSGGRPDRAVTAAKKNESDRRKFCNKSAWPPLSRLWGRQKRPPETGRTGETDNQLPNKGV
jgi:hypothetical protein